MALEKASTFQFILVLIWKPGDSNFWVKIGFPLEWSKIGFQPLSPSYNCITYGNNQRKTPQIAQIRHVEPQKRQYTTTKVGLKLF